MSDEFSYCYQLVEPQFQFLGLLGGIFPFIQILIEHSVSKQ